MVLEKDSKPPKTLWPVISVYSLPTLKALLHQRPRNYGKDSSLGTLKLAAEVCFEKGLTPGEPGDETIRKALKRLKIGLNYFS